ncbi:hypothetical protein C0J52_07342 [Blattella germanica]|nr:hypothetical protein C0J52_07342 [Blattella germanica]
MNSFSKIANEPLNVEMPIFQQEDSTTALLKADTLLRTTQRQLIDVQLAFQETKCDPLKNLETTPTSGNDPPLKRELITTTIKGGVSDYKALLLSGPMMSNKNEQIAIDEEENRNKNKNFVSPAEGMKVDKESSGTVTYLDCQYNRALQQEMFNTRANVEGALTTAKNLSSLLTDGLIKDLYMHNPDKPFKKQTNDTCTYQKDYLKNTMQAKDKFNIPDYELNTTLTVKGKITEDIPTNDQNNDEDKVFRNCDQINPMPMFSENICYCSNCTSAPTSDVKPVAHTTPGYCNCINSRRNTVTQARIMHKKLHLADQKTSREHEDNTTKTHCTCNKDRTNFKKQTKSNCNCIKAYSSEKSATELQEKCACMRVCTCGESMHFSKCSNSAVIHVKTCSESEEIMTQEEIHIGKKLISQVLPSVSIKRDLSVQKIPSVRIPPPGATPYVSANKNVSLWGVSHSQIELDLWDCPSNSQANKERMICQEKSSASKCSCTQTVMRKKKAGKCNLVFETMPAIDLDNGLCAECNAYLSKQELKTGHCISCKNKGQGILSENKIYQEGSYEAGQSNIGNVEQLAAKCIRCLKACNINELYCGLCKICFNVSVHEEITKFCLTSPTPDMIKAAAHLGQCDECHRYFPESELFQGHCIMCQITKKEVRLYQCNLCLNSVPSIEYFEGKCVRCYRMIVYDNSRAATSSKGLAVVQQNVNSVFDGTPFLFDLNVAQGINRIVCSDKNMSRKEENCSTYSRVPTGKEKGKVGKSVMETTKGNLTKGQLMIETNLSSNGDESDDGNENNFESSQMDENLTYKAWLMKRESEGKCDLNESIDLKNDADSDISIDSDSTSKPESVLGWVNSKERQSSIGNDALLSESKRSKRSSKVRYLIDTGASQSDSDTSITKTNLNSGTSSVSVQFVNSKPQIIGEQDIVRSVHIDKSRELKDDESNDSDYEKYLFEKRNAFKRRATPYFGKKEAERLSELMASIIQISNEELQDTSEKNERNPELNEMESNRLSVAIGDVLVSENTSFSDENNDTHPQLNNQTKTEINSKATLNSEYQKNKVRYGSKLNNYKHNESNIKTNSFSQNINEIKPEPKLTLMVKVKPNRAMFEEGSLQEIFQHSQNDQQHNSDRNKIAVRGGERIVREQETQTTSRQAVGSQTTPLFMPQTLEKLTLSEAHRSSAEYPIEQYIIMQDIEDDSVTSETDAKVEEAAATDDKTSVTEGDDIYEDDWEEEPEKKDTVEHSKEPYDDTVSSSSPKPKSSAEHLEEQTSPMAKDPSTSPKNKINCPCNGRKKVKASKVEGENPQLLSAPKMSDKLPRKKRQSNKTDSSDVSTRRKLSGESNKITTQTVQNQNTMKYSEAIYPGKTVNESQEKSEKRIADKSRNTRMKNKENVKEPSDFYPKEDDSASISPRSLDIPNAEKEINLDPSFESNDTIKCPVDIPNKLMDKETLLISKIKALKCPDDLVCTKKEIIPSSGNKVVKCPIDIPCSEEDSLPLDAPTKKGVKHSTQRQTTKCSSNEPCKNKDHSFSSKRQASKVAKCPIEVTCSGEISIPLDEQTENKIAPPVVDVSTSPIRIPLVDRATSLTLGIGKSLMDRETSPIDIPQLEASTSPMSLPEMVDKQISSANILNFTDKETSTMSQPEMIDRQTSANFEEVYPINTQLSLQSSDECVCEDAVAGNICLPEDVNEQKMLMTCVPSDSSDDKDVSSVEMQIGKDFPCKSKCSRDCARGSEFVSRCMYVVKRMNVRTSSQQISEKIKESGNMDSKNKILRRKMQEFSTDTVGSFYSSSEDATGDLDSHCLCSEGEIVSEHREQFEIRSCSQQISSLQERATLETCTTSSREEDDGSSSQTVVLVAGPIAPVRERKKILQKI